MRLVTFQYQGVQEIGALAETYSKIIRLQAGDAADLNVEKIGKLTNYGAGQS